MILQRLSGSLVKFARHGVQLGLAVHGQVGALREVLAQKTVGVLVGAALPGTVGVAEVHLKVGGQRQALVVGDTAPLDLFRAIAAARYFHRN